MFKKVEYRGFESQPDLRERAEQLSPVLADEIHTWRDDIEVAWTPTVPSQKGGLVLTLSLSLPNGIIASRSGTLLPRDFGDAFRLANRCNQVWRDLLGVLIRQLDERVQESILELEPMEA